MSSFKKCYNLPPKEDNVRSLLRFLENTDQPEDFQIVFQNIKNNLALYHVAEVEGFLKYIMPVVRGTMEQIYTTNTSILQSGETEVLILIRRNFQVVLNLMDIVKYVLEYIMKNGTVSFIQIPSVPISMAQMLFLTFEHCKNSQKTHNSLYKSVNEILELFRKTQEIHARFLCFLESCLIFDFSNENQIVAYKEIADIILKIGKSLSGINMKSLADNWRSFITYIQKFSSQGATFLNLSVAIEILTKEINFNLQSIIELEPTDEKKISQNLKLTGFLVKVGLKLIEVGLNFTENYGGILSFWIMIYSWHGDLFQTNKFSDEVVETVNSLIYLCSESVVNVLRNDGVFLKNFCTIEKDYFKLQQSFGVLIFTNVLIKELLLLVKEEPEIVQDFQILTILRIILNSTRNCYMEYFCDYNSSFYEELIIHVSAAILLFSDNYLEIEKLLLECVIQDNIWTSMITTDIWCLVLRHSSENTCRSVLTILLRKLQELKFGKFQQTSAIVRLKILTQRAFKMLPNRIKNEELSKYNPPHELFIWKIISTRNIPMSHRFYLEFIMTDLFEKINITDFENCPSNNFLFLWTLVEFIKDDDSHEISVVPDEWLYMEGNEQFCFWPHSKARKHIKKLTPHNKSWSTWRVRLLLDVGVSYEEALDFEKRKERETEEESLIYDKPSRKRKSKKDPDFVTDNSSEESVYIPPPPKVKILTKDDSNKTNSLDISAASDDTLSITSMDLMPPPPTPSPPVSSSFLVENVHDDELKQTQEQKDIPTVFQIHDMENVEIVYEHVPLQVQKNLTDLDIDRKLNTILQQTTSNKILLTRILNQLNDLSSGSQTSRTIVNFETVPTAPFKKYKKLLEYDNILKESVEAQNQLETMFYMCGGATEQEAIRRGLTKLIADKLAKRCSWLGRQNNFPVCKLHFIQLLKVAVRKIFHKMTEKVFENVVANWCRQATLRFHRKANSKD